MRKSMFTYIYISILFSDRIVDVLV